MTKDVRQIHQLEQSSPDLPSHEPKLSTIMEQISISLKKMVSLSLKLKQEEEKTQLPLVLTVSMNVKKTLKHSLMSMKEIVAHCTNTLPLRISMIHTSRLIY
jgi:hypothetical protein